MTLRTLAAAALVAALAGCGLGSLVKREPTPGIREGTWAEVRGAATRRGSIYDGLEHRASATATFLGAAEREARARRLGEWLGWTPEELQKRLEQERTEAAQGEEFLLSFYTADTRANDLDSPRTVWRVAVEADEGELLPSRVEALDTDTTITGLYPYVGVFDTVYRVRFPPSPKGPLEGRMFTLEIASALGKIDLAYGGRAVMGPDQPLERSSER